MKNTILKINIGALLIGFSFAAVAQVSVSAKTVTNLQKAEKLEGGIHGGGGSRLESAFRLTAAKLIQNIRITPEANELCSAEALEVGLKTSKISVVRKLTDLNTGKAISDRDLDAWTKPGKIQLLSASWKEYLTSDNSLDASVYALVLHELYRTTNDCDDDTGALSTNVIRLLKSSGAVENSGKEERVFSKPAEPVRCQGFGRQLKMIIPTGKLGYTLTTDREGACITKAYARAVKDGDVAIDQKLECGGEMIYKTTLDGHAFFFKANDVVTYCQDAFPGMPGI